MIVLWFILFSEIPFLRILRIPCLFVSSVFASDFCFEYNFQVIILMLTESIVQICGAQEEKSVGQVKYFIPGILWTLAWRECGYGH